MWGLFWLIANTACAAWVISLGNYWALPFSIVGIVTSILWIEES